ncbi:MAG: protease modulator HflC [Piscirickettsiaceae bacterium]|jgi:membrane protease subunit HflC|nr:protease modulator HflC [Piscirickettsiaceae bacterium]
MARINMIIFLAVAAFIVVSSSIFFVEEREKAILLRLGQIERADYEAGIHFKIPFVNNVRRFDGRILTLDATPARYLTGEKKNVMVDSFVLWRISDVSTYFESMGGNEARAQSRITQIAKDGLRGEFGKRTIQQVVSGDRATLVSDMMVSANAIAKDFGIEIVSVRIKRIDLPSEVSSSVFTRMEAERERVASELRSQGAEESEKIRSDADRQRTIILADAKRDSEILRGEGDATSTDIYAKAYEQNSEFYSLYRRLTAYKNIFNGDDMLVIEPKGEFFNHFDSATKQ